ncbi:MAG: hypothetical protein GX977_12410 [Firmicutes bacterium]|nr:hypothetical protein [Bacillota bacterium]
MRRFLKAFFSIFDIRDLHAYGGIILITVGVALMHVPASLIVSGALLLYLALREVKT